MIAATEKRKAFRELHKQAPLILVNPWDIGGVKRLEALGARAIATTSAGLAWSRGVEDFQLGRTGVLEHLTQICAATDLPVNADFEQGFAKSPESLADNVKLALETGVAALSIEDRDGDRLLPIELSVARIRAARQAMDEVDPEAMLVGRCEGLLTGSAELTEVAERLQAYGNAGADVLYAPGVTRPEDAALLVEAVHPKPLNVLLLNPQMRIDDFTAVGVQRFSTGFALSLAAWEGFERAAASVLNQGGLPMA